jgi:hypothetical protein
MSDKTISGSFFSRTRVRGKNNFTEESGYFCSLDVLATGRCILTVHFSSK